MNFVSHYYCAKIEHPYYSLGVLFPDIFNKFSYFHNKFFSKFNPELLDENERMIWNGIEQHYKDDAYFHNSFDFKHFNAQIEIEIAQSELLSRLKRRYLVSHILYELILDYLIIQYQPNIVLSIYKDLEVCNKSVIHYFLEKIMEKHTEIDLFLESYDRFILRRFLNFYSEEHNLVKALHRVTGKISDWEYNEDSEGEFLNVIKKIKSEINFGKTFENIKSHKIIS